MITSVRAVLIATGLALAATLTIAGAAAGAPVGAGTTVEERSTVDGFTVDHVPEGVGSQVGTFEYEWEDVTFRSQVWERGPDAEGAFAVDMTVKVLRGQVLTDLPAVVEFLAGYHEQDPTGWPQVDQGTHRGYLRPGGALFWFVEPGVAVEVTLDETRFPADELLAVARQVQGPAPAPSDGEPEPSGPDR